MIRRVKPVPIDLMAAPIPPRHWQKLRLSVLKQRDGQAVLTAFPHADSPVQLPSRSVPNWPQSHHMEQIRHTIEATWKQLSPRSTIDALVNYTTNVRNINRTQRLQPPANDHRNELLSTLVTGIAVLSKNLDVWFKHTKCQAAISARKHDQGASSDKFNTWYETRTHQLQAEHLRLVRTYAGIKGDVTKLKQYLSSIADVEGKAARQAQRQAQRALHDTRHRLKEHVELFEQRSSDLSELLATRRQGMSFSQSPRQNATIDDVFNRELSTTLLHSDREYNRAMSLHAGALDLIWNIRFEHHAPTFRVVCEVINDIDEQISTRLE